MRAIIMLCLGLWAALLLNPGEVYAQRGLPGQVALGVNGGIADGFPLDAFTKQRVHPVS